MLADESVDFFRVQSICLRAIGISRTDTPRARVLYGVSFFTVLFMELGTVLFAARHIDEIMLVCDCLGPTFTAYLGMVRQASLGRHRATLWAMVDEFGALRDGLAPAELRIMQRYTRFNRLVAWACLWSTGITGLCFVGAALVRVAISEPADWKLPLLMAFPFDTSHPVTFAVLFVACSIAIFWAVMECVACDTTFGAFSSCLVAHLVIIQRRFERIRFDGGRGEAALGTLIEHHRHILSIAERLIDAYRDVILNQLLISSLLLCMLGFQLVVSIGSSLMAVYVVYWTAITIQVTFYCYYGSQLYHESTQVHEAVFQSNWYEADVRTQKMLITCMMRARKAVDARSGFAQASLPTLKAIINSSGSYVALLLSLME